MGRISGLEIDFSKLPYSVPKECLPLLKALDEKGPEMHRGKAGNKGIILYCALQLVDQITPHGFYLTGGEFNGGIVPNDPPQNSSKKFKKTNSLLRLVPPTTQEKGA